MAKRVFNLKDVPVDEANDVRGILDQNGIEYYETREGIWGFSLPAIWVRNDEQFSAARKLIDEIQVQRVLNIRDKLARDKSDGLIDTVFTIFKREPFKVIFYVSIIVLILYFSITPFFKFV